MSITQLSLTQKEDISPERCISNVFLFIYEREYQNRKSQFWRGIITYAWYFIQMTGLCVLCSKYSPTAFSNSDTTSSSSTSSSVKIFQLWMKATVYSRFNPIMGQFTNSSAVVLFYLTFLLSLDIAFVICFIRLSRKSTKVQENNFKKEENSILFVSLFVDYFKWFYLSLKLEIIFSRFMCTYPIVTEVSNTRFICEYLPHLPGDSSSFVSTLSYLLSIFNSITLFFCICLVFVVNHSAEFNPSNPLKSTYSSIKLVEYGLILIAQYLAFLQDNTYAFLAINAKVVYYLFEYVTFFPLFRSDLSPYYLRILCIFGFCLALLTLREFSTILNESYILEVFFVGSSFLSGTVSAIFSQIRQQVRYLKITDESVQYPNFICQHFSEMIQLFTEMREDNHESKLILHGLLTTHQSECSDQKCPCQSGGEDINKDKQTLEVIESEAEISSKKLLNKENQEKDSHSQFDQSKQELSIAKETPDQSSNNNIPVYMTQLMNQQEEFRQWIFEFINYHFRQLLLGMKKNRNSDISEISMKFWFFLINERHNIINALYTIKSQIHEQNNKLKRSSQSNIGKTNRNSGSNSTGASSNNSNGASFFLNVIDVTVTRLVENSIKQKDRSLKYSFLKKDMEEAVQFELFETFVLSEDIKDEFKGKLMKLLEMKQQLMQAMIAGYEELEEMQNQMIKLIESSMDLENQVKNELRFNGQNLHYLKMLSILRIRIQNDPVFASKIEKKIDDVHQKSLAQDVNLIHSRTVLNGNVISIIASFKKEKGRILKYSERTPQFFGYKKAQFDSSVKSVLQLMPSCIAINHDQIIERLIVNGTPRIMRNYRGSIAKEKDGFLFPMKIYVNYFFQLNDDFVFSALLLKLTSNSSFLLLNQQLIIQGMTENFLDIFKTVDETITKELIEQIPVQLFVPDLPDIIEQHFANHHKVEVLKIPMILPQNCSKYFSGYKSWMKKNARSNKSPEKLLSQFMSHSKKFFKTDLYVFEWEFHIVKEKFDLLNNFEFTVYQVEIITILPIQIISNGFQTTVALRSNNDQESDSFQVIKNNKNVKHNNNRNSLFENESIMFTQQYSQNGLKKKYNFVSGTTTGTMFTSGNQQNSQNPNEDEFGQLHSNRSSQFSALNNSNVYQKNNSTGIQNLNNFMKKTEQTSKSPDRKAPRFTQSTFELNLRNESEFSPSVLQTLMVDSPQIYSQIGEGDENAKSNEGNILQNTNNDDSIALDKRHNNNNNRSLTSISPTYDDLDADAAGGTTKNYPNNFPYKHPKQNLNLGKQLSLSQTNLIDAKNFSKKDPSQDNQLSKSKTLHQKRDDSNSKTNYIEEQQKALLSSISNHQQNYNNNLAKNKTKFNNQSDNSAYTQQLSLNQKSSYLSALEPHSETLAANPKKRMTVIHEQNSDGDHDYNQTQNAFTEQNLLTNQNGDISQNFGRNLITNNYVNTLNDQIDPMNTSNFINISKDDSNINTRFNEDDGEDQDEINNKRGYHGKYDYVQQESGKLDVSRMNGRNLKMTKSTTSNVFENSQMIYSNEPTIDKDNPAASTLHMLKESTKYSKRNEDQQDSEGETEERKDEHSLDDENQGSEKANIQLRPVEGGQNEQRGCSVASSQNSQVSTSIQRIYYSASSRRLPFFLGLFFQVIFFQLVFFGSICGIVALIFSTNYSDLKGLTNQMSFNTHFLVPYADYTLFNNANNMQNIGYISYSPMYLSLCKEIANTMFVSLQDDTKQLMNQQISYSYEQEYLSLAMQFYYASEGIKSQGNIYFFEAFKIIFSKVYHIFALPSAQLLLSDDSTYVLQRNYYQLETVISDKVTIGVNQAVLEIENLIETINQDVIILSSTLLFLCFVLLFYPFWRYSQYVKQVLLSVSRMTEKEAEQEIILCRFIQSLLRSSDEKYLQIKYTTLDLASLLSDDLSGMSNQNYVANSNFGKSSKSSQRSGLNLGQKKNYMLSQRINNPRIRLYHFAAYFTALLVFSIIIFATAFTIIQKFQNQLSPCLETYQNYLIAVQKFGSFVYSTDLIFIQRIIAIKDVQSSSYLGSIFISTLNQHRQKDLIVFREFFEADFLLISSKNVFSSTMNNLIDSFQTTNLCDRTEVFTTLQQAVCLEVLDSVMKQGLKPLITRISDEVGMKDIDLWSDSLVLSHIASKEYEEQLQAIQLTLITLIYSMGGILYCVAFLSVCNSVYRNIYRRFFLIKKTVHLVPYKRLQEDQTTINLIKNALEV